jgi:hypothetical protein
MWISLSNAFLSIVSNPDDAATLLVRARRKGDIESVFGSQHEVVTLPGRDYQFRAFIPRNVAASAIGEALKAISYPNFKNSVDDDALHGAYAKVWGVMAALQEIPPYAEADRFKSSTSV